MHAGAFRFIVHIQYKHMHAQVGTEQADVGLCVCVLSVGGRRWLWCIVVALHDPEPECNVSSVQYRGLPDLHAPATHPTTSYDKLLSFLLWQFVGVSPWVLNNYKMNNTAFQVICQTTLSYLSYFSSKGVELLVCDLLLTLRTSLWQRGGSSNGEPGPATGSQLAGFQRDLSALRKVTQCYRQAQHKVRPDVFALCFIT